MAEVERSRFVRATPAELARRLSPETIVAAEGSFEVRRVDDSGDSGDSGDSNDDATVVTVGGGGLSFDLRFERRPDGYYYTQVGDAGPFESMETWLRSTRENEGSRLTARSAVSLAVPLPFADRLAAWKRGGELDRALDALASSVE
ncbi:SRPBCC family protein [Salinigranum marinum]|uniref:SRPBCC family protein n=1 Tax=Salinigranum marinum TaxID=1515595 RepID=UPI002989E847|nr:SRPBCC family protein [Salinigranum marinum]